MFLLGFQNRFWDSEIQIQFYFGILKSNFLKYLYNT